MRFLSVCSGIEAASVAWKPLDWHPVAFSEIEPFPCHVLAHRHRASRPMFMPEPDVAEDDKARRARVAAIRAVSCLPVPSPHRVPNFGDLEAFRSWPDAAIDLLVGGTPCQSFSVAGLRKGLDDPRGNLALVYLAVADRYRPRWVVWENVPGVLSSNGGRDFGAFLGGLGQLGYGWAYRCLDAQFIRTRDLPRAVPQRRRRVFVVGYLGDWRPAATVLFDRQSMRGDPPPRREAWQGAPAGTLRGTDGGCDVDHGRAHHLIPEVSNAIAARDAKQPRAEDNVGIIPVAPTLRAGGNATGGDRPYGTDVDTADSLIPVTHALRGEGFDASEDGSGRGTPLVPVKNKVVEARAEEPRGGPVNPIAFSAKDHGADAVEGISPTLRAGGHGGSHANAGVMPAIAFDAQASGETGFAIGDVAGALHGGGKHGGRAAVAFAENSRGELRLPDGDGQVSPQLATGGGKPGQGYPAVAQPFTIMERGRAGERSLESRQDGTANAILTPNGGRAGLGVGAVALPWAVRRLTPVECERLQGFPDNYTLIPYGKRLRAAAKEELAAYFHRTGQYMKEVADGKWEFDRASFEAAWPAMSADGPRYKALGNSMAVNAMQFIGERIAFVEAVLEAQRDGNGVWRDE